MTFVQDYASPLGNILLAGDVAGLTGLWFYGQKYFAAALPAAHIRQETPVLAETRRWLDLLFCRAGTRFHAAAAPGRFRLSPGCLGYSAANPLR